MNTWESVEFSSSASESWARPGRGAGLLEDEVENNKQQEGLWTIGYKNKQDQYWGKKPIVVIVEKYDWEIERQTFRFVAKMKNDTLLQLKI